MISVVAVPGADVALRSPLTTQYEIASAPGPRRVAVRVVVPRDAPADLGIGVFTADRDGHWWQQPIASQLTPGEHRFAIVLDGDAALGSEPPSAGWNSARRTGRVGVFLWSGRSSKAVVQVEINTSPEPVPGHTAILTDLVPGPRRIPTGERWELSVRPEPMPADPFSEEAFALELQVGEPDGAKRTLRGFLREPMRSSDRGDREDMVAVAQPAFAVRFRPSKPGRHSLALVARWAGGRSARMELPDLEATGAPRDDVVRVDAGDPRFFSVAGRFWWPVGLNLHNPYDLRSRETNGTRLTPARGSLTYEAMLDRLAAAGGDATEIWMSSWNLALAWRADWPGFDGLDGLNLANAERLDRILDHAWSRGIRVNLVINNHGQAAARADREWKDNPLNSALGGPLAEPALVFTDPAALAHQERLRRYITARWADHPAVMGWKLWSEIDLTAARGEPLLRWHEQAAARWKALDPYGHPVTTHWSGDYRRVDPAVAALPGLGYLCLDAYRRAHDEDPMPLADIVSGSLWDTTRGLSRFAKPVLITEFGAAPGASPEEFRAVDHRSGAWLGLVSGNAGAPMLWWWEWVDQGGRWQPYQAIRGFIAGEDLRSPSGRSYALEAGGLWARAWLYTGRALGYVQEPKWGARGGEAPQVVGATVRLGDQVEAGHLHVQWWDADRGTIISEAAIDHPGGALDLKPPTFAGHIAFKAWREKSP